MANARPVPVPVVNDVSKTKSEVKKTEVKKSDDVKESGKDFFKSSNTNGSKNEETSKNGVVESKPQKVTKLAQPEKKDRLKSMFAAAATKPKPKRRIPAARKSRKRKKVRTRVSCDVITFTLYCFVFSKRNLVNESFKSLLIEQNLPL